MRIDHPRSGSEIDLDLFAGGDFVEEKQEEVILRNAHNVIAGRYCKIKDRTYSAHGGIVSASGNTLLTPLCRDQRQLVRRATYGIS